MSRDLNKDFRVFYMYLLAIYISKPLSTVTMHHRNISYEEIESFNADGTPKNPGSFTGPDKLYRLVKKEGKYKIGRMRIRQWLQDQDSYGLSRNVVR